VRFRCPGIIRYAGEVSVREKSLGKRGKGDAADALLFEDLEQPVLDPI
jgi:hypothetical protein